MLRSSTSLGPRSRYIASIIASGLPDPEQRRSTLDDPLLAALEEPDYRVPEWILQGHIPGIEVCPSFLCLLIASQAAPVVLL